MTTPLIGFRMPAKSFGHQVLVFRFGDRHFLCPKLIHLALCVGSRLSTLVYTETEAFSRQIAGEMFSVLETPFQELSREDLIYCLEHCVEMGLIAPARAATLSLKLCMSSTWNVAGAN